MIQLILFEFQKIVQKKVVIAGLLLIAAVNIISYMSWGISGYEIGTSDGRVLFGREAMKYEEEMEETYGGNLTDEKVERILDEYQSLSYEDNSFIPMNSMYEAIYILFTDEGVRTGDTVEELFPYYKNPPQLGIGIGWGRFMMCLSSVMLCTGFLIVVAAAPVFSEEYSIGTDALLLTSKYGKHRCAKAKTAAAVLLSLLVVGTIVLVNLILFLTTFGIQNTKASAQLDGMGMLCNLPHEITFIQAAVWTMILWLVSGITLTALVLLVSAVSRSSFLALVISLLFYMYPISIQADNGIVGRFLNLNPIRSMIGYAPLEQGEVTILGCSVPYPWLICIFMVCMITAAWFLCKKAFADHQVVS